MQSKLSKLIKEYFDEQKLMQLASVSDGSPWLCNVWQATDDDLNVYFFSSRDRRHSIEIDRDNRVAGALAVHAEPTDEFARGLQFEGRAKRLTSQSDIDHARKFYEGRIFDAKKIDDFMNDAEKPHVFYKIVVKKIVLFDTKNYPEESRQEIEFN